MVGPLERIAELEEGYRSAPAGWLAGTGMEMPIIDGRENKLFQLHIHERVSFVCLRSKMTPPAEFEQKYRLEWKNNKLYATEKDLVVHTMDQYSKPLPRKGAVAYLQLTHSFSLMFGTGPGEGVHSVVVDRSN
ncbi:MAG: hypothetical protein GY820_30420, partial [Gammaproteobacteria bacterium]|nr:hypothetical protein [Gammaproteobacteria bacterium]